MSKMLLQYAVPQIKNTSTTVPLNLIGWAAFQEWLFTVCITLLVCVCKFHRQAKWAVCVLVEGIFSNSGDQWQLLTSECLSEILKKEKKEKRNLFKNTFIQEWFISKPLTSSLISEWNKNSCKNGGPWGTP